ncbi:membrane associated rhomboid family serine protease [Naumannella cuiyingiana]|uniref:Membrane associated rhomboid family serine protease n=1 Tax=Naumannella cuiyingiana TaxID=1347891 RepID=A0A7Z0DB26_9ACTN|nr:rhomboid family intramembrane serine protease [Naumannella cuiyingiana]NYI72046.1 membrane associated rhomboid family serine protease [Naumannella cuiyingiana]
MAPASVGFQCPECVGAANEGVRRPRGAAARGNQPQMALPGGFGLRLGFGAPVVLAAVVALFGIADLITGGMFTMLMAWISQAAAAGEVWRAITWTLVPGGLFAMIINVLMILLIGNAIEAMVGSARTIAVWVIAGLGGVAALALFGGPDAAAYGASAAIFGLLGANAVLKFRQGMDVRPDLILFALLIVMNVVLGGVGGSLLGVVSLLGGILGGALAGALIGWAPGNAAARGRNQWLLLGGGAVALAGLTAVGLALA